MKAKLSKIATALILSATFLTACESRPKSAPKPIISIAEHYNAASNHSSRNDEPARGVYTIRRADGTYDTFTTVHGKIVSKKNTPTLP